MNTRSRIDLVAPGLFGPVPVAQGDLPEFPALSLLLGRADRHAASGSDATGVLFDRFGIELAPGRDPPSAPFCRLAGTPGATLEGYWLHADPVHLRPNRDGLVLFDARHLDLKREEAHSLGELFNRHFAAEGLHLETTCAEHWYLHMDTAPQLLTRALPSQVGRAVDPSFLSGKDAVRWMRWLNETQMLFCQSDVNQRRELDGRLTVSGIWPWGGGTLPPEMPQCRYGTVFARDALTMGLATAAGISACLLPENVRGMLDAWSADRVLLFWDSLWPAVLDADVGNWIQGLSGLSAWLDELFGLLKRGEVERLVLYPCDGTSLAVTGRALRRFWRRPVGMEAHLKRRPGS